MSERGPNNLTRATLAVAIIAAVGAAVYLAVRLKRSEDAANAKVEKSFKNDVSEIRPVDPKLIGYKQTKEIATGMEIVRGIAVDRGGRVIVAGDQKLKIFDRGDPIEASLGSTPTCVAAKDDGTILVGLRDHVEVYSAAGRKLGSWPALGKDSYITCIATHGDDVWIADAGQNVVLRCDGEGKPAPAEQYKRIEGMTLFSPHMDVAVAPDEIVWVSNPGKHKLQPYKRDGRPVPGAWGAYGPQIERFVGCCNPADFAILPDGNFVTSEKGAARVKVCRIDGSLECVVADTTTLGPNLIEADVAVDGDGRVYVADPLRKCVRVFEKKEGGQ